MSFANPLMLLLLLPVMALAESPAVTPVPGMTMSTPAMSPASITVQGTAQVLADPDQVTVTLASESTSAVSVMAGLVIDTTITKKRVTSLSSALDRQKEILIAAEDKITLMSTEIELIAQKVDINAEQIALKASKEEVGELSRRMSAAEVAIDGANAAIALKASQATVDDLGTRVSAAEVAIDGANAEIALKVSKNGVVSAINMSTEGIKISASRIELSGTVIAGYLNGTSIDVNELSASMVYASGGIQAPSATIDGAYIGDLDCDSLSIGGTGYSGKSRTVVVGQQTLTPTYVTIQYKDHNGNNQYTQVLKAVTINDASKATISYLGT